MLLTDAVLADTRTVAIQGKRSGVNVPLYSRVLGMYEHIKHQATEIERLAERERTLEAAVEGYKTCVRSIQWLYPYISEEPPE